MFVKVFGLLAGKKSLGIIDLSNLLTMSVPEEGYRAH
jgi:hypothetical protein